MSHDPATAPDPAVWLTLSDTARHDMVAHWHSAHPNPMIHRRTPDAMHARMHAAIETQIALGEPAIAAQTVDRLTGDGLNRHVAIHSVMDVFMRQMVATMTSGQPFDGDAYAHELSQLNGADIVARRLGKP